MKLSQFIYRCFYFLKTRFLAWQKKEHSAYMRQNILKLGGKIGKNVRIDRDVIISGMKNVKIGNNVSIGSNCFIWANGGLEIGNNTVISRNLILHTDNHNYQGKTLPFDYQDVSRPVKIGNNVWIGTHVKICPGTVIEDGAIIGMGTVIFGRVPKRAIVGSPKFKVIKHRDKEHYQKLLKKKAFLRKFK
ncbi:MAG: acyltransferase [Candidatus Pacebacteria bacterium]|nr:acyltransferase [Candidatus Paceibacterota bacterium]